MKTSILPILLVIVISGCLPREKTLQEKADLIHKRVLTVDSHTDSPWYLLQGNFDMAARHDFATDGSRLGFQRMKEGGLDAVFFAAFVGQRELTEDGYAKAWDKVNRTIDSIHVHALQRDSLAGIALSSSDAYKLEQQGKRAIFIGIENGYGIGNEIKNIAYFYDHGARYITLCHTRNNDICDSSTDSVVFNGLSAFGVDLVREMNRTGMMVDVSHISDSSFYDVLAVSTAPVIASHSCARALCDSPRNLNDDMLVQLAKNGGVIQVCILSDYVKKADPYPERDSAFQAVKDKYGDFNTLTPEQEKLAWQDWERVDSLFPRKLATVAEAVDHIDHIVKVAGIDHVGIGTDFDGGGGLADCRDVSQLDRITLELVKRGYTEEDIRKIWGGNLMRVMDAVQEKRAADL